MKKKKASNLFSIFEDQLQPQKMVTLVKIKFLFLAGI